MTRLFISDEMREPTAGASTATDSAIEKLAVALRNSPLVRKETKQRIAALLVQLLVRIDKGYEKQHLIPTLDLLIEELKIVAYANKSPSAKQRKRLAEASIHQTVEK